MVPGLGHATAGGPAPPGPKTLCRLEVHEGLFPRLGEYQGWLGCDQGHNARHLYGESAAIYAVRRTGLGGRSQGYHHCVAYGSPAPLWPWFPIFRDVGVDECTGFEGALWDV